MTIEAIDFGRLYRDHLATTTRTRKDASAWDSRAAGMATVAALWGYRLAGDRPLDWGADALVERPRDLLVPGCWPGVASRTT